MEERTKSESSEGCWVIARCAGGHYIGRVTLLMLPEWNGLTEVAKWGVVDGGNEDNVQRATAIKLDPGYEFICQPQIATTQQGPAMTGKFFFAMAVGASVKDSAIYLNMTGGMIQPFSKLHAVDVETYKDIVRIANQQMEESYKHMVASRAGIVLTGKMPENRGDGSKFRA